MELVGGDAERDQGIGIEEVRHGSSSSSRATRSLVTVGPFAAGFKTGSPVRTLVESRDDGRRSRLGVSTTRSWSISTRSESPATRPSFRRTGLGRTICPLLDRRASMARHLTSPSAGSARTPPSGRNAFESALVSPWRPPPPRANPSHVPRRLSPAQPPVRLSSREFEELRHRGRKRKTSLDALLTGLRALRRRAAAGSDVPAAILEGLDGLIRQVQAAVDAAGHVARLVGLPRSVLARREAR